MTDLPPPPAHVARYVDVLGTDLAVTFLLHFGGAEVHISARPTDRSELVQLLGKDAAQRLADHAERLPARVPTAKPWLAEVFRAQGLPVAAIARRLHASDVAVRRWLRQAEAERARRRQMTLF